jgi:hypothetical protein
MPRAAQSSSFFISSPTLLIFWVVCYCFLIATVLKGIYLFIYLLRSARDGTQGLTMLGKHSTTEPHTQCTYYWFLTREGDCFVYVEIRDIKIKEENKIQDVFKYALYLFSHNPSPFVLYLLLR